MLVLQVGLDDPVYIQGNITVRVVKGNGTRFKLAFDAPKDIAIEREAVFNRHSTTSADDAEDAAIERMMAAEVPLHKIHQKLDDNEQMRAIREWENKR